MDNNCNTEKSTCTNNDGNQLILLAAMIAIILGKDLNSSKQNLLGSFLQTVGQNLTLLSAQKSDCESMEQ